MSGVSTSTPTRDTRTPLVGFEIGGAREGDGDVGMMMKRMNKESRSEE